jgi:hypothetical protein
MVFSNLNIFLFSSEDSMQQAMSTICNVVTEFVRFLHLLKVMLRSYLFIDVITTIEIKNNSFSNSFLIL